MNRRPPVVAGALALVAVGLVALPVVGLAQRADWGHIGRDLTSPAALQAARLSLTSSLWSTVVVLILGTPLAWILARTDVPGRSFVRGLVLLPMVLPPVVGGVALLSAFSLRSPLGGWLDRTFAIQLTFSPAGVVLAQVFVAMPFFVLTVEAAFRNLDQRYEQVAATLGASPLTTFRRVTLPLVAPSMAAGAVLAWARALGEFGATITFAGNIAGRTRTLPLEVYLQLESDRDAAVALSLALVGVALLVLVLLRDRWLTAAAAR